jgi:hypothetical protein
VGLFRKMASASTLGMVDMRSDKERTARKTAKAARYAKVAAREAQAQTKLMEQQHRPLQPSQALLEAAEARRVARGAGSRPLPERLAELNALWEAGTITVAERDARRAEILREI